ncbi:unnamed protein product [Protopolystoma xenopodis]|uniref:Uncharacterized protein n=1 Tax=Protopolystoma xenopodis TaxID=117903 RepID=A0A3S5CUJ3_9PLAT|nr:unnamed protein product [Protopolystoma xenopodis]
MIKCRWRGRPDYLRTGDEVRNWPKSVGKLLFGQPTRHEPVEWPLNYASDLHDPLRTSWFGSFVGASVCDRQKLRGSVGRKRKQSPARWSTTGLGLGLGLRIRQSVRHFHFVEMDTS